MWLSEDTDKLYREIQKQEIIRWRAEDEIAKAEKIIRSCKEELKRLKARAEFEMSKEELKKCQNQNVN